MYKENIKIKTVHLQSNALHVQQDKPPWMPPKFVNLVLVVNIKSFQLLLPMVANPVPSEVRPHQAHQHASSALLGKDSLPIHQLNILTQLAFHVTLE